MIMKLCWIVGSVFLILVVVSLGVFIPWCNHTISQIQNELATLEWDREMRFRNLQWFLGHDLKEKQDVIEIYLLKLLKDNKEMQIAQTRRLKESQKAFPSFIVQ